MKETQAIETMKNWHLRWIQLLTIPGMLVAFYLLLFHNGSLVAVCGTSGWDDCGVVSGPDAPYSSIGPIPVALLGLVGYLLLFLLVWLQGVWLWYDDNLPELLVGVTGLAFLFSLGLTALELFVIHAICRYCVVSAVIVTLMFVLALNNLRTANLLATVES